MSGRRAGRRAVLRWSVRLFRREWRQQVLVLALLTVAVSAAVAGSAVAINAASDSSGEYGDARALIRLDGGDGATAQAGITAARQRFGTVDVIAHTTVAVPGSIRPLDVRDQDPNGTYDQPMLTLRAGRYPAAAGEVALTRDAADLFDAAIGSTIDMDGATATVVGIVENPADLRDDFALVAPGTLPSPSSYTLLIDPGGTNGTVEAPTVPGQTQFHVYGAGSDKQAIAASVLVAATLAMALVGLIAATGFLVVAQRRQRQLGLLAAIGATERHVRLVMLANGVIVGVIAGGVGTAVGIGGWLLASSAVESAANHRIGRFDLPWMLILAVLALAVAMATLAAWWPARTVSRLPVMAALSGRPARPKAVHRSLLVAVVLVAGGVAGIIAAQPMSEDVRPLLLVVGLLAVVIGAVFAAPAAIRVLGPLARRLPFAPRLALRDLARYQARAAAALAAITLGLGMSVAIIGVAAASQQRAGVGNLSDRELLIQVGDPWTAPNPDLTVIERAQLDQRAATVVAALGDGYTSVPLDVAFTPRRSNDPNGREPISVGLSRGPNSLEAMGFPYIATPEVLALYGIDAASINDATDLVTGRTEAGLRLIDITERPDLEAPPSPTQLVALPAYTSAPSTLVTPAAVARNGWTQARAAWIVESPHALTTAQIRAARDAAAAAGLAVEVRSEQDGISALQTGSTVVGGLLAMAIVAMAVGLIRGESRRDIATLTATGAAATTRRALTASTAAALAVLGVVLGMGGAYIALLAAYHADLGLLVPVPVTHLIALGVGLPVVATIAGWILAGREPRSFARQVLD